jgi:protein involved in polysaccharide export with SLBB domain
MKKYYLLGSMLFFVLSLQGQSLTGVNVDDLSDSQILSIVEQGETQGFNSENGEEMAIKLGLSIEEASKFKMRLEKLKSSNKQSNISAENDVDFVQVEKDIQQISSQEVSNDSSKIFGHNYFNNKHSYSNKTNDAKAPRNYILGSGDELTVSVFGISFFQKTFRVGQSGILNLGSRFGRIKIRGMPFENVEKLVRARISRSFDLSKNTFDLSLSYGRNISVNITGEVENPGTYLFSALNNAFHAIVAAGGPTKFGSLRAVEVYRNGRVVEIIDFYQFFTNPTHFKIPFLQDGDFLMVPTGFNFVSTSGAFRKEMSFEMLPDETVADLIAFSSGFSPNAYKKKIKILRNNDNEKRIIDVKLEDFGSVIMKNGDSVFVNFQNGELEKFVTIDGALAQPGDYGYVEGMTLGDLINLAGGVVGLYVDKEIILSKYMSNGSYKAIRIPFSDEDALDFNLSILDNVFIGFKPLNIDEKIFSVFGSVENPGEYIFSDGISLEDAINRAGGFKIDGNNDRIEITRQITVNNEDVSGKISRSTKIISLDSRFKENKQGEYKKSNFMLEPFDEISVTKIRDFGLSKRVYITGAIFFPGIYTISTQLERVSDLVSRAGGISKEADLSNSVFFRQTRENVVFNLGNALDGGKYNFVLEDLDSIFVPHKNELISIEGNGHLFFEEYGEFSMNVPKVKAFRSYKYIQEFSLGLNKKAKKKDIYVSYPNGKLDRSKRILFLWNISPKVKTGGVIHVNKRESKIQRATTPKKPLDWNQLVATITSAAMGFGTVYALITRP